MDERMPETPGQDVQGGGLSEKASELSAKVAKAAQRGRARAKRYGGVARGRLVKQADSRKGHLASELENLARTVDDLSASLGERGRRSQQKVASQGASMLRKASVTLREKSSEELVVSAENELKARPTAYLAGLFALGFLGVRLLRGERGGAPE